MVEMCGRDGSGICDVDTTHPRYLQQVSCPNPSHLPQKAYRLSPAKPLPNRLVPNTHALVSSPSSRLCYLRRRILTVCHVNRVLLSVSTRLL